ncbi:diguanylate cyclase [Alkaliphilus pronyensis]|uniref:Diguanylate cyclase n=1 Tax=Alkaliphilus pronyensis TaxID=1482732 RepID=A0A6I0FC18_9FIRM|nr:GGDEF domain-containing protein [Alkaliphilus pronyensis]KAB3530336.1 diguanylate cyclase [Alkaliphilus pronyensis]
MRKVSDIMNTSFCTVDIMDSIHKIKSIYCQKKKEHFVFPVKCSDKIVGIITAYELICCDPNSLVADAMKRHSITISPNESLWRAREIFNQHKEEEYIIIASSNVVLGVLTKTTLITETSKYTDLLTGLYRADYIYYKASKLMEAGNEITVVFLDVNDFGKVDKDYGHIHGDIILKEISQLIGEILPSDTYLCRFAGDEFLFVSSRTKEETIKITNNLLKKVAEHTFHNNIKITLSAGISGGDRKRKRDYDVITTISDLINLASLASTKAKKGSSSIYTLDSDSIA